MFLFDPLPLQWLYDKQQIQDIVRALNKLRDTSVFGGGSYNIDGGHADTIYGGTTGIDGGGA